MCWGRRIALPDIYVGFFALPQAVRCPPIAALFYRHSAILKAGTPGNFMVRQPIRRRWLTAILYQQHRAVYRSEFDLLRFVSRPRNPVADRKEDDSTAGTRPKSREICATSGLRMEVSVVWNRNELYNGKQQNAQASGGPRV